MTDYSESVTKIIESAAYWRSQNQFELAADLLEIVSIAESYLVKERLRLTAEKPCPLNAFTETREQLKEMSKERTWGRAP